MSMSGEMTVHEVPREDRRGRWIPRAGVTSTCELPGTHGCCKLNMDPLKSAFPSFSPLYVFISLSTNTPIC